MNISMEDTKLWLRLAHIRLEAQMTYNKSDIV